MPDDFEGPDIDALYRRHLRQQGAEAADRPSVMREQAARREGLAMRDAPAALARVDGGYTLHGAPLRDGQVIEVYTNEANGWLRGLVAGAGDRPRLVISLWNPWGGRDVDGLPPRVGTFEAEIPEGAMCRWSAALPREID